MRKRLFIPAVTLLTAIAGCNQSPVEAVTHTTSVADHLTTTADSTSRGGNVMGGGH